MGTHPIFESDFDCLTECFVSPPEPFPFPPPADRSTPSRPSSSTRSENTRPDPRLKVSSTVALLSPRRVLTFRSDSPELTEVETWTSSQRSPSPLPTFTKTASMASEPSTSSSLRQLVPTFKKLSRWTKSLFIGSHMCLYLYPAFGVQNNTTLEF